MQITPLSMTNYKSNINRQLQNRNNLMFKAGTNQTSSIKHFIKTLGMISLFAVPVILSGCTNLSENKKNQSTQIETKTDMPEQTEQINMSNQTETKKATFDPEEDFGVGLKRKHAQAIMKVLNYNNDHEGHKITRINANTFMGSIKTYLDDGSSYRSYAGRISRDDNTMLFENEHNYNEDIIIKLDKNGEFEIRHSGRENGEVGTYCFKFDKNGKLKQSLSPAIIQKTLNQISVFDNYNDVKTILANLMATEKINSIDFKVNNDKSVTIYAEQSNASYKIQLRDDNGTLYGLVNKLSGNESQIYAVKMVDESTNKIKRLFIAKECVVSDINGNIQSKNQTESHSHEKVNEYKVSGGLFSSAILPTNTYTFTKKYMSDKAKYIICAYDSQTKELKCNNNIINANYSTDYEVI